MEEQGVPIELEIDEYDHQDAVHFLGRIDKELVSVARVCLIGSVAKIQRMAVLKRYRGRKLGKNMMKFMIDHIRSEKMASEIALDAQTYAQAFYAKLGFEPVGDEFDDAGIPHIHMVRKA